MPRTILHRLRPARVFHLAIPAMFVLGCAAAVALASGCGILGVVAYKFAPPKRIPPAYPLEQSKPVVIMVDRATNFGEVAQNAQWISQSVTDQLRAFKADPPLPEIIDSGKAFEARTRLGPDGQRLKPSQIADAAGAQQFIYVEISRYDASTTLGGEGAEASVDARVWVVDTESAEVLWPVGMGAGYPVSAKLPFTPIAGQVTQDSLKAQLDDKLAAQISRLFTGYIEEP